MDKNEGLMVDQIARCHARHEKIRKLARQMTLSNDAGTPSAIRMARQRNRAIATLRRSCPHSLLMEVAHDAWRGPYRPLRLCEICGLVESAWRFDRLVGGRTRPGSRADCRRIYLDLLGQPVPDVLADPPASWIARTLEPASLV
jgi:hypothetical protein